MTRVTTSETVCACGYSGESEVYDSVNVVVSPELKTLVKEKKINSFICPDCGKNNELLNKFLYTDTDNGLWVWCYPEGQREDFETIKKQIDSDSEILKKEFGESDFIEPKIVFGFDELLQVIQ